MPKAHKKSMEVASLRHSKSVDRSRRKATKALNMPKPKKAPRRK